MRAITLVFAVCLAMGGCGDSASTGTSDTVGDVAGDGSDAVDLTGRSAYHLDVTLPSGEVLTLDRGLGAVPLDFAFGSTHIAPAVSLAMSDNVSFPRTMVIDINFGIVVPSSMFTIDTTGPGTYDFGDMEPNVDVFVNQGGGLALQYSSKNAGSSGQIIVEEWGVETGDLVKGTFSGSLMSENGQMTLGVDGWFHFTLPQKASGQPGS